MYKDDHTQFKQPRSLLWDPWCNDNSITEIIYIYNIENYTSNFNCWEVSKVILNGRWALTTSLNSTLICLIHYTLIDELNLGHIWMAERNPKFKSFLWQFLSTCPEVSWHNYVWNKRFALDFSMLVWPAFMVALKMSMFLVNMGSILRMFALSIFLISNPTTIYFLNVNLLFPSLSLSFPCWGIVFFALIYIKRFKASLITGLMVLSKDSIFYPLAMSSILFGE